MNTPLHRTLAATLDDLTPAPGTAHTEPTSVLAFLVAIGDGLRARLPLPQALRRWLRSSREDVLAAALARLAAEHAAWSFVPGSADDPSLPSVLRRRDEAESVRASIEWRSVALAPGARLSEALATLDQALLGVDQTLASVLSRDALDALLGARTALEDRGWRARFSNAAVANESTDDIVPMHEPAAELIDAWLREGTLFRGVEGHARRDADFADKLHELFEFALKDAHLDRSLRVSFVARRWAHARRGDGRLPRIDVVTAPRLMAAATEPTDAAVETLELGALAPLDAFADVRCDGAHATLRIFAAPGAVAALRWGDVEALAPEEGEPWLVTVPYSGEVWTVTVRAPDGASVAFELSLLPAAPASP